MAHATQIQKLDDTTTDDSTLPSVPSDLKAPRTKLVYLSLHAAGEATVDELHARLEEPRLSLFPVLSDLKDRGLVTVDDEAYSLTA